MSDDFDLPPPPPPKGKGSGVSVWLFPDQQAYVEALSKERNTSVSEVIQSLIDAHKARRAKKPKRSPRRPAG